MWIPCARNDGLQGRARFTDFGAANRQQREDMKHAMVKMLCGQLHFAPIGEHPHEILDIGTGTGIWAIESGLLPRRSRLCLCVKLIV